MSNANLLSRQSNRLFDGSIPVSISTLSVGTLQSGSIAPVEVQSDVDFVPAGQYGIGGLGACETGALFSLTQQVATLQGADISFLGDVQVLGGLEVSGSVIHSGDLNVIGDLSCAGSVSVGTQLLFNEVSGNILLGVSSVSGDIVGGIAIASGAGAGAVLDHSGAIVISADPSAPLVSTDVGLFVKPVRGVAHGVGVGVCVYDPVASEMTYSTT